MIMMTCIHSHRMCVTRANESFNDITKKNKMKALEAAPVAEWLRSLTSVLLIIRSSHQCGFAPRTGHEFICETSHVLLAGVSGGFSPGTPVFAPPTD